MRTTVARGERWASMAPRRFRPPTTCTFLRPRAASPSRATRSGAANPRCEPHAGAREKRRLGAAGAECEHVDRQSAELARKRLRIEEVEGLGGAVGREIRGRLKGGRAADDDEAGAAAPRRGALEHLRQERAGERHHRHHVDLDHLALALGRVVDHAAEAPEAGVVDEELDGKCRRRREETAPSGLACEIGRDRLDTPPALREGGLGRGELRRVPSRKQKVGLRRQRAGKGGADAARRPGDRSERVSHGKMPPREGRESIADEGRRVRGRSGTLAGWRACG